MYGIESLGCVSYVSIRKIQVYTPHVRRLRYDIVALVISYLASYNQKPGLIFLSADPYHTCFEKSRQPFCHGGVMVW